MKKNKCYENYPLSTVITAVLLQLSIFSIGAYIVSLVGTLWMALYILFIAAFEIQVMAKSCVNCYYYGKICFSGLGRLAPLFFKKGNPKRFIKREISFKDVIPDLMISLIPVIISIILLIIHFSIVLLALLFLLLALTFWGNGFVRGKLACKFCRQRKLGCPAERMFNKKRG